MATPYAHPYTYIGDGAYVRDHGFEICIYTSNGISEENHVYLEPEAIESLIRFIEKQRGLKITIERREDTNVPES